MIIGAAMLKRFSTKRKPELSIIAQGKVITLTITGVAEGMENCVSTQGPR